MTQELTEARLMEIAVAAEAVMNAAKAELKARGQADYAQGVVSSWKTTDDSVSATVTRTHDRLTVTDAAAFYGFMAELFPHNFREVTTVTVEAINPQWVDKQLDKMLDDLQRGETSVDDLPPGVTFTKGGQFGSVTVTPKRGLKDSIQKLARQYFANGQVPALTDMSVAPLALEVLEKTPG